METFDAVVVGAGPAGLTAGVYLVRYRRRVLVLGAGPSRAAWIPESHNTPGFPHGVGGRDLLARLTEQALAFGAEVREGHVEAVTPVEDGFEVRGPGWSLRAATVLLATGVLDRLPTLEGVADAIRRSVVRMCPICDAYEATGKRIAILGAAEDDGLAEREADFLASYSQDVTVLRVGEGEIALTEDAVHWTPPGGGNAEVFDHLYLALGCEPQGALAVGAARDEEGNLIVDAHQMTGTPGLYAAGDLVRGLNQIAVATGEAAIAATAMHNRLRGV